MNMPRAVIVVRVPIVVNLLRVQEHKQIGNEDVLWVNLCTIAARGTRNQIHRMINCLHLFDRSALGFIQRLEILHEDQIVAHLIKIAHAGKRHHHAREARGESDCIAASVQVVEYFFRRIRKIHEVTALDRLHDQNGLVEFAANLAAFAALYRRILVIQIII